MQTVRGLTLLEIVVVIAMIFIFAVLLMPVASSSRESASRTRCASNVRQLLIAMYLYSDTVPSQGTFPTLSRSPTDTFAQTEPAAAALNMLYPIYVADPRLFSCPSDKRRPTSAQLQQIQKWPLKGPGPSVRMTPLHTSYAYDPGHTTNISSMVALISDKPGANRNSDNHGVSAGQNVGFGTSVEFRESLRNLLSDGAMDNNIFTLGDTTGGSSGSVTRDEDSFIRE